MKTHFAVLMQQQQQKKHTRSNDRLFQDKTERGEREREGGRERGRGDAVQAEFLCCCESMQSEWLWLEN